MIEMRNIISLSLNLPAWSFKEVKNKGKCQYTKGKYIYIYIYNNILRAHPYNFIWLNWFLGPYINLRMLISSRTVRGITTLGRSNMLFSSETLSFDGTIFEIILIL